MYKASFDKDLLKDWCDFCEGIKEFDEFHFSTLLMETFLEGYTRELNDFLKEITKYFDSSVFKNLEYTFNNDKPDKGDIKSWVSNDLREKKKIFSDIRDAADLVDIIDKQNYIIVHDRQELYTARESENHSIIYDEVGDYAYNHLIDDKRLFALIEVLYNIASDYNLVYGILNGVIEGEVDFSNYLEIYRRGCDYAVSDESIVIYVYKP